MREKEEIYAKPDFTNEDGIKAAELECEFGKLNGWEAESEASTLLQGLGIGTDLHDNLLTWGFFMLTRQQRTWTMPKNVGPTRRRKGEGTACPSFIREADYPHPGRTHQPLGY